MQNSFQIENPNPSFLETSRWGALPERSYLCVEKLFRDRPAARSISYNVIGQFIESCRMFPHVQPDLAHHGYHHQKPASR